MTWRFRRALYVSGMVGRSEVKRECEGELELWRVSFLSSYSGKTLV